MSQAPPPPRGWASSSAHPAVALNGRMLGLRIIFRERVPLMGRPFRRQWAQKHQRKWGVDPAARGAHGLKGWTGRARGLSHQQDPVWL